MITEQNVTEQNVSKITVLILEILPELNSFYEML